MRRPRAAGSGGIEPANIPTGGMPGMAWAAVEPAHRWLENTMTFKVLAKSWHLAPACRPRPRDGSARPETGSGLRIARCDARALGSRSAAQSARWIGSRPVSSASIKPDQTLKPDQRQPPRTTRNRAPGTCERRAPAGREGPASSQARLGIDVESAPVWVRTSRPPRRGSAGWAGRRHRHQHVRCRDHPPPANNRRGAS